MNDSELDGLLESWEAPAPPASLREGLRARFPRAERRGFGRPLRWGLAIAAASATLGIGMEQAGESGWDFRLVRVLNQMYEHVVEGLEAHMSALLVARIRQSDPKVYVDGQSGAPPEFRAATRIDVQVPGDGVYSVISFPGVTGWVEAGRIHGNTIEFQAGGKQVRIVCNQAIVNADRPVFVRRRR